jgi:hypothetical protein
VREIKMWLGTQATVIKYHGSQKERGAMREQARAFLARQFTPRCDGSPAPSSRDSLPHAVTAHPRLPRATVYPAL